jgi:hypothetical protein
MVTPTAVADGQPRATGQDRLPSLETRITRTLQLNPGSRRVGKRSILLKPGVMASLPMDREPSARVARASSHECSHGWLCAWPHSWYRGPALGIQRGVYIDYHEWMWHDNGSVSYCPRSGGGCTAPGLHSFAYSISSVFNNLGTLQWAPFYDPVRRMNYYALAGYPAPYVGREWNDHFTAACAC